MPEHLESPGYPLEHLGDILTDPTHLPATVRTGAPDIVGDDLPRERRREGLTRWACRPWRRHRRGLLRRDVGLELLKLELDLLDRLGQLLRGAPELHAAQARQLHLQIIDLKGGVQDLRLGEA